MIVDASRREPLLTVRGLVKHFPIGDGMFSHREGVVRAVDGVDLDLLPGETLALVGESGCGKSTTARAILRLVEPTAGEVLFDGASVGAMDRTELRAFRRRAQIVYQDPAGALNPRMSAGDVLTEALSVHGLGGSDVRRRAVELLECVGLGPEHERSYPHELSGGQRQRLGIARALSVEPDLLVLDEPVSALDVSVRAQVVNLLLELQRDLGLAYLFIAHDLPLVELISDRVAVMYLGRIVEAGKTSDVFSSALHPYTRALLSSIPSWRAGRTGARERILLPGEAPSPLVPASGCPFHPRCPHPEKDEACTGAIPTLKAVSTARFAACVKASPHP